MRLIIFLLATMLLGQEPLSIKVDVSLVNVAFIVRDGNGALAGNLTKDDIEVLEDGVPQQVRFFGRSSDLPLRLALLMDVSPSQDKFNKRHSSDIGAFVESALGKKDQAMLVCFGDRIRVVSAFSGSPTQMMDELTRFMTKNSKKEAYMELDPDKTRTDGTALFDAIYAASTRQPAGTGAERKAVIVFSDGQDNSSAHDLLDAIEAAQTSGSLIYTVRYSKTEFKSRDRYGAREMNRLAEETGGAAFDASKGDVVQSLKQVAEELRSMYDVGYTTTNPNADGRFRKVEIRVKRPGMTVRAKPGYYAR